MRFVLVTVALAALFAFSVPAAAATGDEPRARLERVLGDPGRADDPAEVAALAKDAASFPPGDARTRARMFVAEAWLGRLRGACAGGACGPKATTELALEQLRAVRDDPATDALTARVAERALVEALGAAGRLDEAAAEAQAHADRLDAAFVATTRARLRRRSLLASAEIELAAFALLAARALARAVRRGALSGAGAAIGRSAPLAMAFAAYIALAGGTLASGYETGNAMPFVGFGLAALPVLLAARAWSAVGSSRPWARGGRAALCALSVLSAALVVLDALNPMYLDGFGL